jgi:cyanophycinase-like exopeptidase
VADDPTLSTRSATPASFYFSGGNPLFLADTIGDTLLWQVIVERWQQGTALGGCSAGAMAFGAWVPDIRHPTKPGRPGLGLLPQLRVLPHFDKFLGRMPDLLIRPLLRDLPGVVTVGIDEETALVGGPQTFTVQGRSSAWLIEHGHRREIPGGESITVTKPH